ncbi:MAG: amino acid adenylation domain-containing protein [Eubacterium sp.]|nr:amino acid adenylation domain-containing protein [Eubacterium sp.]
MKNILDYLENTAFHKGTETAVEFENKSISWTELMNTSKQIGTGIAMKIGTKKPIPILAGKGIDTLCAFFGAAYAGCFYVLLNPQLPEVRLKSILKTLEADYLFTTDEHLELAKSLCSNAATISSVKISADNELLEEIRNKAIDTDPLYALFTSGSTGEPKGVLVSHRNVIDFIDGFTDMFNINENDIIANQAPFDFDVSVKDIYSSLKMGARLVIVPTEMFSRPTELIDYLAEHNVTTLIWAVSALCLISTFHCLDYRRPDKISKILFSGEVMPAKHLAEWQKYYPDAMFVNLYGPTEITCNCTYHIINDSRDYDNGIPIGKPFNNREILLLDENNNLISESNVTGEICVRGSSVAIGYCNNPEQTAKAFVQNPTNTLFPDIIYRTGDLAEYDENGDLFFCGRKDFQIKYMGHRIELEEIEKAMNGIDGISRSCCVFEEKKNKLYGFYIGEIEKEELHRKLSEKLPVFMVPGALRKADEFPLTKNGKTDRKKLVELYGRRRK